MAEMYKIDIDVKTHTLTLSLTPLGNTGPQLWTTVGDAAMVPVASWFLRDDF